MSQPSPSLTTRTTRGVQWRFGGAAVGGISQFAIGILLARLLPPADFGLVALAFIVIGLVRPVGDLGIGNAVVQRAGLNERHVRNAFTLAMLFGLSITLILVLLAPLGSFVLRDTRVVPIIRLLALTFAFQSAGVVAGALLRREFRFRDLFVIDTASYLLGYGVVSVTLALRGFGVYSLVWGGLAQAFLNATFQLATVRHSTKPLVSSEESRQLLHFGVGSSLNALINYFALNGDNFVVGRWMGAMSLGLYSRAYNLMNLPYTHGANAISAVLFPAFSEVQGENERLSRAYLMATQFTAVFAGCAMTVLAIAAPDLIVGLYGPRWSGVVAPLQILCFAGYFRALYHLGGIVVQSVGLVYREARRQAVYSVLVIVGAYIGTRYGLPGVAIGVTVAILYMFAATAQLALGAVRSSWMEYLRNQTGAFATCIVAAVFALAARTAVDLSHARPVVKGLTILAAGAIPSCASLGWHLSQPAFDQLRSGLPKWSVYLVGFSRRLVFFLPEKKF